MILSCQQFREMLDDAVDARLDDAGRAAFEAHASGCPACASERGFATSLRSAMLDVGIGRAPRGLKQAIASEVRMLARPAPRAVAWRTPWLRAAAGILVITAVGFFGLRSWNRERETAGPSIRDDGGGAPAGLAASGDERLGKAGAAPARRIATGSADSDWAAAPITATAVDPGFLADRDGRARAALTNVRAIVAAGPAAVEQLNRVAGPGATPEARLRQAEVLLLLHENVDAIAQAAGEAPALAQLGQDADDALSVFYARERLQAAAPRESRDGEAVEKDSALKVIPAAGPAARGGAGRGGPPPPAASAPAGSDPALYVVSGPGVVARVERVLADRSLAFQPVWLQDQADNEKKRRLDQAATDYRVVEVSVPEDHLADLIGDLESLAEISLRPIGRSDRAAVGAASDPAAARDGAALDTRPKALSIRKLRLFLIGR